MKHPAIFLSLCFGFLLVIGLFLSPVFAASANTNDFGLSETADIGKISGQTDVPAMLGKIVGSALSLIGIIFFALMIYGGLRWMFSMGNTEQSSKALQIIFSAIIGLLIVTAAYAITQFVFTASIGKGYAGSGSNFVCKQSYNTLGLGCYSDGNCDINVDVTSVFKSVGKGTFDPSSTYKISGICSGGTSVVCCVKSKSK